VTLICLFGIVYGSHVLSMNNNDY